MRDFDSVLRAEIEKITQFQLMRGR